MGFALAAQRLAAQVLGAPASGDTVAGTRVLAVWKEQHLHFFYLGRTSRYSCDGLHDKVRAMMLDLGARRDLKVAALGCADYGSVSPRSGTPSLNIVFSALVPADPTAKPARDGDLAATDARFEPFTIASDAFRNMSMGDCELVEEFARQILPKFVTRDLKKDITCVPYQQSGSRFLVKGQILRPLPPTEQPDRNVRAP